MTEKLERRPLLKKFATHSASFPVYPTPQVTPQIPPLKKGGSNGAAKASKAAKRKLKGLSTQPLPPPPQEFSPRDSEEILIGDHSKGLYVNHHIPSPTNRMYRRIPSALFISPFERQWLRCSCKPLKAFGNGLTHDPF